MLSLLRAGPAPGPARGFRDDAAVAPFPLGQELVATHDVLAEGIHFLPDTPPADVGWKLVAVNWSDLAAMGARPLGALLGLAVGPGRDAGWVAGLLKGVDEALATFTGALWGGDTVRTAADTVLGLTALGAAVPGRVLGRAGARAGDWLWVSGTIGDAGLGLEIARGRRPAHPFLLRRHRRPTPRVALGQALVGVATACIDVSDGLLLDALRLAEASGCAAEIELERIPRSGPARALEVDVLDLATSGDDYELLFAADPARAEDVRAAARAARTPVTPIGRMAPGRGLGLKTHGRAVDPPERLGFQH
ncbi:MAG: thiamine-phosphate kinase [Sphingomonadaceae bacterium]|uniref:thiamine-phosphate kinase n=1 Tax=Thermaurantiacus sp. TaxID=2820283 RepID=UPI00298EF0F2|nr:thiamine-phosphate kinase [Thermaurantiacus sp.]MCS6985986.1 thiamine-phosphate kinase [Sphingomonadaceae bacterium]MDW8414798.1 thiamine-phosphate kinase [Thermaurantiacus sp.]